MIKQRERIKLEVKKTFDLTSGVLVFFSVSAHKRLGCYRDNRQQQRPLHHLLFTDREESSPKYSGIKYTKEIYDRRYLDYLIKRCALECKKFGYEVFGIEKFGMNSNDCCYVWLFKSIHSRNMDLKNDSYFQKAGCKLESSLPQHPNFRAFPLFYCIKG